MMSFFLAFGALQTGLVVGILLFAHQGPKHPRNLLAAHLAVLGVLLLHSTLIESGTIMRVPHFFRIGVPVSYLIGPTAYLYVRAVLYRENALRPNDLWHGLPALLNTLELLPYFVGSTAYKRELLADLLANEGMILTMEQGILPAGLHLVLRSGSALGYALYLIYLVRGWDRRVERSGHLVPVPPPTRRWLFWFSLLLAVLGGGIFLVSIFYSQLLPLTWSIVNIILTGETLCILVILFFRPGILYGLGQKELNHEKSYSGSILEPDQLVAYKEQIESYMDAEKPYLRPGYKLTELAAETGIPRHQLSACINDGFGMHFNDFINAKRIRHATETLSPEKWKTLSIAGISQECGFRSRSSFTRAFKKSTGMTPTDYRMQR